MEEDEYVVEGGAQLVGQHLELDIVPDHGQDVLLQEDEALAREPDDVADEIGRFWRICAIWTALLPSLDELPGEVDRKAENLEEDR